MLIKNLKSLVILFIAGISFISCERTINDVDLPFEERLFIEGMINTDRPVRVRVTRMIDPIKEEMGVDNILTDAQVSISDGENDYELEYLNMPDPSAQSYYINLDMKIERGKEYTIKVEWNNLKASASTLIPDSIQVYDWEEIMDDDDYNLRLFYDTLGLGEHYLRVSSEWLSPSSLQLIENYYFDNPSRDNLDMYYWDLQRDDDEDYIVIENLDPAFYTFLNSIDSDDDFFFGSSGTNPIGNVRGDGFGYFFGASWSRFRLSEFD